MSLQSLAINRKQEIRWKQQVFRLSAVQTDLWQMQSREKKKQNVSDIRLLLKLPWEAAEKECVRHKTRKNSKVVL